MLDRVARDLRPGRRRRCRVRARRRRRRPAADDLELLDGVGALEVGGDEQRRVALGLELLGELAGQRRLARALQAGEHDHGRRRLGEAQQSGLAAEDADELLVDDLDDLLRRVEALADLRAAGALLDRSAMNALTTGSATSASSSAMRISRSVASMSASDRRPLPRSDVKTLSSRSERVSNTSASLAGPGDTGSPAAGLSNRQCRRARGGAPTHCQFGSERGPRRE